MIFNLKERFFLTTHKGQLSDLHRVAWVYTIVFLVWGFYRLMLRLPLWFEEVFLKMVVFGLPVLWVVLRQEKKRLEDLGMSTKGLLISVYLGLFFGLWLAVFGNIASFLKTGGSAFNPNIGVGEFGNLMLLGLFTAFWEELLFMGYMLPRVVKDLKNEWLGIAVVAVLFALLHLPVQLVESVGVGQILLRMILLISLAVGNGILYLRVKNLAAPVFAHLVWGSVVFLFG